MVFHLWRERIYKCHSCIIFINSMFHRYATYLSPHIRLCKSNTKICAFDAVVESHWAWWQILDGLALGGIQLKTIWRLVLLFHWKTICYEFLLFGIQNFRKQLHLFHSECIRNLERYNCWIQSGSIRNLHGLNIWNQWFTCTVRTNRPEIVF